jgi:hypothetical protein
MAYCLCRFAGEVRQYVWNVQIPRNEKHFRAFWLGALIASAELMVYSVWLAIGELGFEMAFLYMSERVHE